MPDGSDDEINYELRDPESCQRKEGREAPKQQCANAQNRTCLPDHPEQRGNIPEGFEALTPSLWQLGVFRRSRPHRVRFRPISQRNCSFSRMSSFLLVFRPLENQRLRLMGESDSTVSQPSKP